MELRSIAGGFTSSADAWTQALRARLKRTTPRERLLLGGLVLGVLIYSPLALYEWRDAQAERYSDALSERAAARLSRDAARRVAAAVDDRALEDMRQWGFRASNVAVAGVLIERRVLDAARDAGLPNARLTVEDELNTEGPIPWLETELQADLVWRGVFGTLDALTAWPEGFRVTRFRYEMRPVQPGAVSFPGGPPAGTVRIGLAFPVEVPAGAATPDDAGLTNAQPVATRGPSA